VLILLCGGQQLKRTHLAIVLLLGFMLVWVPFDVPYTSSVNSPSISNIRDESIDHSILSQDIGTQAGVLDPVLIEHTGAASGGIQYQVGRTDTEHNPSSAVYLPTGVSGNSYSAECSGGYFIVDDSFASSEGTISLWIKWDVNAPHGRFWGQDTDFETRWENDRLRLDWGSDNTILGNKNDWISNYWYFISIVWDQSTNYLAIFWGDEDTEPTEDVSSFLWTASVVGVYYENNIMSSRRQPSYSVNGHVDDFRYFTIARSLEDLRSDYKTILTGTEEGLAHHYEFENDLTDSIGGVTLDSVGSYSFTKDVVFGESSWNAEQIEVGVRNLQLLHVLNGTFDTGYPGENRDWGGDGQYYADGWLARREVVTYYGYQYASYIDLSPKYLLIENEGSEVQSPPGSRHYNSTKIYWYQFVDNSRLTEEFKFSMNYLYQRGPIGLNYRDIFKFSFDILNGSNIMWSWSIDPTNITEREVWYHINPINISIPEAPSSFEVRISLQVNTTSSYVEIPDTDPDLDGNPTNGASVRLLIDDVSLVATEVLDLEGVDFLINIEPLGNIPINGNDGSGSITLEYNYWSKMANPFSFSSNSSVYFEYYARITLMTKFCNSTYSKDLQNLGVAFEVEPNQDPEFSFYTKIESYPEATDLGLRVHYSKDWENPIITSPDGFDVSDNATIELGYLELPSGLIDSEGWWKITIDGVNYAYSVYTQVLTPTGLIWNAESEFNCGNRIRCRATLGTDTQLLQNVTVVEINWHGPSDDIWFNEILSNPNSSLVTSCGNTLGPNNASIGAWIVSVSWTNGTEVAFGLANFTLYHRLTVIANTPNIEIESGDEKTIAIYLYDQDNGNPILSEADVNGNWSTSTIKFNPNLAKGWWESDINSTGLSPGEYTIVVEVVIPYFHIASTSVIVSIPDAESLYAITVRASIFGALLVLLSVVGVALGRRFYMTMMSKRNLELLILERRIDDAKNLIGLLVIHRSIGLPIYSNILKGGFQESLLSSLISAISQFRSEFSMDEPTWTAIPITEVITAVQTEALICAIITVEPASSRQKTQLEAFGREVGGLYDHEDDTIREMVRSPTLYDTFDSIFESYFDGQLIKKYVGVKKDLPRHLNAVSRAIDTMDIDHGVTVDTIIKTTSLLGYSERIAHKLVLEAVDEGYLIAAEKKLPLPIDLEE
jgi:hypothetical protein